MSDYYQATLLKENVYRITSSEYVFMDLLLTVVLNDGLQLDVQPSTPVTVNLELYTQLYKWGL